MTKCIFTFSKMFLRSFLIEEGKYDSSSTIQIPGLLENKILR